MIEYLACVLAGAVVVACVFALGGPVWAAYGIGYLVFLVNRLGSRK